MSGITREPQGFLIIDDSEDFLLLAASFLRKEWPKASILKYNPLLRGRPPLDFAWAAFDVVLLDYRLGQDDGLRWLRTYGRSAGFPQTIMLTGEGSEEVAVTALKLGARDYIPKRRFSREVLIDAVRAALERPHHISQPDQDSPQIPGYRLLEKIGEGTSATVYRAERLSDKQDLVVKILRREDGNVEQDVDRFLQEYAILERVRHPGVVRTYDLACSNEVLYVAVEYCAGGTLREHMRRQQRLPPATALAYARQIAEALTALHDAGVVHRDLKPSNVMFRGDGSLVIIDFGIAKQVESTHDATLPNRVMGTPGYLSPEALTGKTIDARSDLYSLGVVLFEMLDGQHPFASPNIPAMIYQQLEGRPPRLPLLLTRYQEVVNRLMARNSADRFESAAEAIVALRELENQLALETAKTGGRA